MQIQSRGAHRRSQVTGDVRTGTEIVLFVPDFEMMCRPLEEIERAAASMVTTCLVARKLALTTVTSDETTKEE